MVDIDKLETFLQATETLYFSETVKRLHLNQLTVSHHIKILEKSMRVVLFTRTNTGLPLTEVGRLLLTWACLVANRACPRLDDPTAPEQQLNSGFEKETFL
jgi:LysR family transcriptional repressor of citA